MGGAAYFAGGGPCLLNQRVALSEPDWAAFLESAFLSVLETADEGIFVFDADGRCRMIGRRAGELFGIEPAAHVGKPRRDVLRALAQACEEPEAFLATVAGNDLVDPPVVAEVDIRRPRPRSLVWTTLPIVHGGVAIGRLGLVRDITRERSAERAQKQLHARLTELTHIDPLTGLMNIRRFREELEREHARSVRAWDSYAIVRFDVDGMGAINEEYGTPVGDAVLEKVGERLKSCLRDYDVLARLEADEFVALLPGADAVAAKVVAERMTRTIYMHNFQLVGHPRVTMSAGGCVWVPPSGLGGHDILVRAGVAISAARSQGAGTIRVDSPAPTPSKPPVRA
jgi:diguanylate cyclase (GGDEF)-like protein